jgi:putative ABC transport system substrate-binding protein
LGAFAAELAALPVSVLVAGGDTAAVAAKAATGTIPVVFMVADDPVRLGLVSSFNLPNSNATGISLITSALGSKRLELIREMVPNAHVIGLLINPNNPSADSHSEEVQTAAHSLGLRLIVFPASTEGEFEGAFEALRKNGAGALVLQSDPFFDSKRAALIALALRYAIPAVYHIREFPNSGGLLSYGPSLVDGYGQLGSIVGRMLKGGWPHDIPVARPTRFELVINLKTAKALGLTIPPTLLARADEVIE